jgi:SAM-dependent methyltransferase
MSMDDVRQEQQEQDEQAQRVQDEQFRLWNGTAGQAWVEAQDLLDRMFKPFERLLVEAVGYASARRVLDVGCGTGSTTLACAQVAGEPDGCVGIDISEPMIELARARAAAQGSAARFICADAQRHRFPPGEFDMITSRFGVMFFEDPVQAFANLREAASNGAALCCIAWRSPTENPFMTTAERAAAPLLPELPVRLPGSPGQFAFADAARVKAILEAAGWWAVSIEPLDVEVTFPEAELVRYLTLMGPVGGALRQADAQTRERVIATVRPAFDCFVHGDQVRINAACWDIRASC